MKPIIGMDVRIDEKGRLQPWRVVLTTLDRPERQKEYLMRVPAGLRYLTELQDPQYGSIMAMPSEAGVQFKLLAERIDGMGASQVYAADAHLQGPASTMLAWHGISILPVKVEIEAGEELNDPFNIGGEAGHEIGTIVRYLQENGK